MISSVPLPTLGLPDISPEDEAAQNEARLAGNASWAGQILSSEDAVDASLGYVRGIGENLLNQQVNDWLNRWATPVFSLAAIKPVMRMYWSR